MKTPMCKLCGKAHWSYEDHAGMETGAPEYVKEMAAGALRMDGPPAPLVEIPPQVVPTNVPTQLTDVPTCECGKPKEGRYKKCAACRKRAYRERSRG